MSMRKRTVTEDKKKSEEEEETSSVSTVLSSPDYGYHRRRVEERKRERTESITEKPFRPQPKVLADDSTDAASRVFRKVAQVEV
jgi:hypothetical protein